MTTIVIDVCIVIFIFPIKLKHNIISLISEYDFEGSLSPSSHLFPPKYHIGAILQFFWIAAFIV